MLLQLSDAETFEQYEPDGINIYETKGSVLLYAILQVISEITPKKSYRYFFRDIDLAMDKEMIGTIIGDIDDIIDAYAVLVVDGVGKFILMSDCSENAQYFLEHFELAKKSKMFIF